MRRTHGSVAPTPSVTINPGLFAVSVWTASSSAPMAAPASVSAVNSLCYRVCTCVHVLSFCKQLQESRPPLKETRQEVACSCPSQQRVCVFSVAEVHHDINHCQRGTHNCDVTERARCSYTGGATYACTCLPGFTGDGRACQGEVSGLQLFA